MPRSPEYVKAKSYDRWKFDKLKKFEGFEGGKKPKEKPGKPAKETKDPAEPVQKEPQEIKDEPRAIGPGKEPLAIEQKGPVRPHGNEGPPQPALEGRGGPSLAIGPGPGPGPRPHGGPEAPAIGGGIRPDFRLAPGRTRPALPGRDQSTTNDRQFLPEVDRRRADLANLVAEVKARQAKNAGPGEHTGTGEIVEPGNSFQKPSGDTDKSIWTAEVVGHNDGKDTGKIRAIEAPFNAKATGPIPRVHDTTSFDRTAPLPQAKAVVDTDTTKLPRQSGRIALTQHAEPLGQMSLFQTPGHEKTLAVAQQDRSGRQAAIPTSTMPKGRQVNFMQTNLPKKPGSQGTLFKPVTFKPPESKQADDPSIHAHPGRFKIT